MRRIPRKGRSSERVLSPGVFSLKLIENSIGLDGLETLLLVEKSSSEVL